MKQIILLFLLVSLNLYGVSVEDGIAESKKGNNVKAFKIFEKACDDENNRVACKYVAEAYNKGIAIKADVEKALAYYVKSCSLGLGRSCLFIANSYNKGTGVKKDYTKALEFYEKACQNSVADACQHYAFCYEIGRGVKRDLYVAKEYYKKSCELGIDKGCFYVKQLTQMGVK